RDNLQGGSKSREGNFHQRPGRRHTKSKDEVDDRDAKTEGGCQIPAPLRTCHCSAIRISLTLAGTQQKRAFSDFGANYCWQCCTDRSPDIAANMLVISLRAGRPRQALAPCRVLRF